MNVDEITHDLLRTILVKLETLETFVTRYPTPPALKMKPDDAATWQPLIDNWLNNRPAPRIFKLADMLRQALDEDRCSHKLKIAVCEYLRTKGYQAEQLMNNGDRGLFWREGLPLGWQDKLAAWFKASKKTYFTNNEIFIKGMQLDRARITYGAKRALSAYLKDQGFEDRYTLAGGQLGLYWLTPDHVHITSTTDYYPEKSGDEYDKPKALETHKTKQAHQAPANSDIIIDDDWGDDLDDDTDDLI
jgi:hypothetical protein